MKLTQHGTHRTSQSWSVSMCFVFSTYSAKKRSYLQIARIHRIHRMSCNITSQHITILTILRMVETSAMENTVFHSKISSDQVGSRYNQWSNVQTKVIPKQLPAHLTTGFEDVDLAQKCLGMVRVFDATQRKHDYTIIIILYMIIYIW